MTQYLSGNLNVKLFSFTSWFQENYFSGPWCWKYLHLRLQLQYRSWNRFSKTWRWKAIFIAHNFSGNLNNQQLFLFTSWFQENYFSEILCWKCLHLRFQLQYLFTIIKPGLKDKLQWHKSLNNYLWRWTFQDKGQR